MLFDVF